MANKTDMSLLHRAVALSVIATAAASPAWAGSETDLPVAAADVPRGTGESVAADPIAPVAKIVDGQLSDWMGVPTMFGGTAAYSAGELIYQDHIFDAYGADDGRDAQRMAIFDPVREEVPEAYRLDALLEANVPGQVGLDTPGPLRYRTNYGDVSHQDEADLLELRVAADSTNVYVAARTTTMKTPTATGLLLLADTGEGSLGQIPFNSGLTTKSADVAVFLTGAGGLVTNSDGVSELPAGSVAVNDAGYTNAIEAAIPRSLLVQPGKEYKGNGNGVEHGKAFRDRLTLTAATGLANGDGFADTELNVNVANVAFRFDEPVREWFDKAQALTLQTGSMDRFAYDVDLDKLASGATERFVPGPGYHDRLFVSTESISKEGGRNGIYQRYGAYIPTSYEPGTPTPLQWWLHWRGGTAHQAAHLTPRVFKHFGEDADTVVVAPEGRGTGRWYVGIGHVDFLEVWDDAFKTFSIDENRVYSTGHSMGGWGTYLLTTLYPDRFAAGAPVAGPVTQGAWFGCEFSQCYISANGGRPQDQFTRKMLDNLRHVPLAILHGTLDELVPYGGVARQAEQLTRLGYRFRLYTFPTYEHYSHPIVDQWAEAVRYEHSFVRDPNPARVTYKRDMPFELATEQVQSEGVPLDFEFDGAYWVSGLTAADALKGAAIVDARSLAIPDDPYVEIPEAGGPASLGQSGPYVMKGLAWLTDPMGSAPAPENAFQARLTGATAVQFDLLRMSIDPTQVVTGDISSEEPLELSLDGDWTTTPSITVNGEPATATLADGVLTIPLQPGDSKVVITDA